MSFHDHFLRGASFFPLLFLQEALIAFQAPLAFDIKDFKVLIIIIIIIILLSLCCLDYVIDMQCLKLRRRF